MVQPKLTFISPCTPDKNGVGWEKRAYSFLSAYLNRFQVDLWMCQSLDHTDVRKAYPYLSQCNSVRFFEVEDLKQRYYENPAFREIRKSTQDAAVVHVFKILEAPIRLQHPRLILDIDELHPALHHDTRFEKADQRAARNKYQEAARNSRLIIACSAFEHCDVFENFAVVPNSIDDPICLKTENASHPPLSSPILLFVGNFNHRPNLEAIDYFMREIVPLLDHQLENPRFVFAGRHPQKSEVRAWLDSLKSESIEIHYNVEDLSRVYQASTIVVAPMVSGGGTKLKIIEAMAHRRPIVSTTRGIRGLDVVPGEHLLIGDEPASFATCCEQLAASADLRQYLSKNTYALYCRTHSPAAIQHVIGQALDQYL